MAVEGTAGDKDVLDHINDLAHEEHALFEKESRGEASRSDRERLKEIGVQLDQCSGPAASAPGPPRRGNGSLRKPMRADGTVEGCIN